MVRHGYAKLMNDFYINGKIKQLRATCPSAVGAFVFAIAWCSDNLTDGRISDRDLRYVLGVTDEEIDALCGVDLLEPDGNEGYVIHEYTKHNNSKSRVEKKRAYDNKYYAQKRTGKTPENGVQSVGNEFQSTESEVQSTESVCNRTKHKNQNTRTNTDTPYNPPRGGERDGGHGSDEPSSARTRQFDQFWSLYPNHDYPDAAIREFKRVMHRKDERVPFEALLQGAQILAGENRDPRYIPAASKWLHDGGWKNKPKPRAPASPPGMNRSQQNLDHNRQVVERALAREQQEADRRQAGRELTA